MLGILIFVILSIGCVIGEFVLVFLIVGMVVCILDFLFDFGCILIVYLYKLIIELFIIEEWN